MQCRLMGMHSLATCQWVPGNVGTLECMYFVNVGDDTKCEGHSSVTLS